MTTIFDSGCLVNNSNTFVISLKQELLKSAENGAKYFDKNVASVTLCCLAISMAALICPVDANGSNSTLIRAR